MTASTTAWKPVIVLVVVVVAATLSWSMVIPPHRQAQAATSSSGLHVVGNQIENGNGQVLRLLGVDRSGTEYACIQGWGIFDGPNDAASVQAIASWHVNAVRVPLNEDCWLNINMGSSPYGGATYQQAVVSYVNLLNTSGIVAILDLHWNAPGTSQATGQQPMADADHTPAFWQSVATTFKSNSSVIFDLYNEPYGISWSCWRDGGTCSGVSYPVAGMQQLVTAVRTTGASNILMLGGLSYSNDLSQWLSYEPSDPQNNLSASVHVYGGNPCTTTACFDSEYGPVVAQVPLIAGEIGESYDGSVCGTTQDQTTTSWLDAHTASYLAWTWDTWGTSCGDLSLILDYSGTPKSPNGTYYQSHLAAVAGPTTTCGTGSSVTIQAGAGWNMVGGSPLTLWSDSLVNWAWNASTGQWYHPTSSAPCGTGSWEDVSTAGPRSVTVWSCSAPISVTVVAHRWNLVGNPCSTQVSLPSTARAYRWDPSVNHYDLVTSINPGTAAWVNPASTALILSPG